MLICHILKKMLVINMLTGNIFIKKWACSTKLFDISFENIKYHDIWWFYLCLRTRYITYDTHKDTIVTTKWTKHIWITYRYSFTCNVYITSNDVWLKLHFTLWTQFVRSFKRHEAKYVCSLENRLLKCNQKYRMILDFDAWEI